MTLNQTIYQLLSNVTKVPIIRAFQSGIEPSKPFITYAVKWVVMMALHTYSQQTKWLNAGVVLVDTGQLSDMPYLNEANAYENRAVLEIQIRHKLSVEDDIDFFNQVELTDADSQTTIIVEVEHGKY